MKIGIIRFSSLGDVVLTTGVIRELKRGLGGVEIVMITSKAYEEIFRCNPSVEKILALEEKNSKALLKLICQVRREKLDAIVDLHLNPRSVILSALSRSERKLRYRKARRCRTRMISEKRRVPCGHVAARYFEPFTTLGVSSTELSPEIWIDPETERKAESLVGDDRSLVVAISPGANRATKRWSDEEFGGLARLLTEKRRARVVVVGDTKDTEVATRVAEISGEETVNLAGRTSLLELAAVLKRASLLVTNDSGPMHVAAAVRTPVVALFGPTVPEFGFSPLGKRDRIMEVDLPCRPCSLHGTRRCSEGSLRCMRLIKSDEVFKVVSDVLNGRQA